jgi:two-component system chemotaxis response regulator CheB
MQTKELIEATCPDCRGPLSEHQEENLREFRCLVGHSFSARTLLQAHSEVQERALWAAVVALEESAKLIEYVARALPPAVVERLEAQAREKQRQAGEIRKILQRLEPFQTEVSDGDG